MHLLGELCPVKFPLSSWWSIVSRETESSLASAAGCFSRLFWLQESRNPHTSDRSHMQLSLLFVIPVTHPQEMSVEVQLPLHPASFCPPRWQLQAEMGRKCTESKAGVLQPLFHTNRLTNCRKVPLNKQFSFPTIWRGGRGSVILCSYRWWVCIGLRVSGSHKDDSCVVTKEAGVGVLLLLITQEEETPRMKCVTEEILI